MRAPDRHSHALTPAQALARTGSAASDGLVAVTDRQVQTFLHELSNLVDGSLRSVKLAQQDVCVAPSESLSGASRRLEAAAAALTHIADMIHGLQHPLLGERASGRCFENPRPFAEAVAHAVEVSRPLADERRIVITLDLSPTLHSAPAFPIYAVVTNALRNSIEAIGTRTGGAIHVRAHVRPQPGGDAVAVVEISDDGPGPGDDAIKRAFEFGFSTKEGASGVGLAVACDIVRQAGGDISLMAASASHPRPGALLRITLPFPLNHTPAPEAGA